MDLLNKSIKSGTIAETSSKIWDIDVQTGLCQVCSSCKFGDILSGGEINHHLSYADLSAASSSGCRLCSLIMSCRFARLGKNAKIICEIAWGENRNSWKYNNADPVLALRFRDYSVSRVGYDEFSCTIGICTTQDDLLATRVPYRLVESDSGSQRSIEAAARWLTKCLKTHEKFCSNTDTVLPTRVVYVGTEGNREDPHLIVTKGEYGKWAALSHCWGPGPHFTTSTLNLKQRQQRIPFPDLPATFRDAVTICRRLHIDYLWIDSLCILQDSEEDWRAESAKMHHIYINALITIIAEASASSHNGIFAASNACRLPPPVEIPFLNSEGRSLGTVYTRHGAVNSGFLFPEGTGDIHMFTPGPASQRAWTFQEDILSSRILRFAGDNLSWTCLTVFHGEGNYEIPSLTSQRNAVYSPKNFRRKDMVAGEGSNTRTTPQFWYIMVERYNKRMLTFEKDKLPAISAIAREVAAITGYTYKAGIWLEDAYTGLRWKAAGTGKRHTEYTAPSWSWASLSHSSDYFYMVFFASSKEIATILDMDVTIIGDDIYGQISSASLKISGPCRDVDFCLDLFPHIYDDAVKERSKGWLDGTHFNWDVEKGKPGCGIICMQLAKIQPSYENPSRLIIHALLLQPIDQHSPKSEYRRIGLLQIQDGEPEWANRWEVRTLTII